MPGRGAIDVPVLFWLFFLASGGGGGRFLTLLSAISRLSCCEMSSVEVEVAVVDSLSSAPKGSSRELVVDSGWDGSFGASLIGLPWRGFGGGGRCRSDVVADGRGVLLELSSSVLSIS